MKIRLRQKITALALLTSLFSFGQMDTSVQLISKIDIAPQFELHDSKLIGLMGYTKLLSQPIDLPSPTLIFEEGDSVNLSMWNLSQGAPHTIHLHGLDVDQANDGVPQLSFEIPHDSTGNYYFKAPHPGTYIYHCHVMSVLHVQAGMYGLLIVKPKSDPNLTWENGYEFDKEYAWMLSEVDTNWHHDSILNAPHSQHHVHTVLPYYPQHFLINGRSETQLGATPITTSVGEKVYMRFANIGYYANQVVFPPEMNAQIIASDGRPLPNSIQSDTVKVFPGERFGVLLEADTEFQDVIEVAYINLNTHQIENTQEVNLIVSGFVNLEEFIQEPQFAVPNPASTSVKLPYKGSWLVADLSGRILLEINSDSTNFDISAIRNGTYILKHLQHPENSLKLVVRR